MAPIAEFTGFPEDAPQFLQDLAAHNDRHWFRTQRKRFDEVLREPARSFVAAIEEPLRAIAPEVTIEPSTGESIVRLDRGLPVTSQEKPYRETFRIRFWQGEPPDRAPAYYVAFGPDWLEIGAGVPDPDERTLARFQSAAADSTLGPMLVEDLDAVMDRGDYRLGGRSIELPDKYEPDNPRADLVARDAFYVYWRGEPSQEIHDAAFVDAVARRFRHFRPAYDWLVRILAP